VVSAPGSAAHAVLERVRSEYVVLVTGVVRARSAVNAKIPTGEVEVLAESVTILNTVTRSLPFAINGAEAASEEVRLKCAARVPRLRVRSCGLDGSRSPLRAPGTARWTCANAPCPTTCACGTASSRRCGACWRTSTTFWRRVHPALARQRAALGVC
jgi:hypothetical protein